MFQTIKHYITYRKAYKTAKRELALLAAKVLPAVRTFSEKRLQTLQFIQKLADSTKNLEGEVLIQELLEATAEKLTAAAMERSEGSERGDS